MNTRQTGNVYEQMAADYLEKQGMRILERNFRRGRNGEIDIIGRDGKYLVFVEVKYRSGDEKGNAAEAVTTAKQRTICRVAQTVYSRDKKGNWSIWYSRSWKRPVWWNICLPQGPVVSATESIPL